MASIRNIEGTHNEVMMRVPSADTGRHERSYEQREWGESSIARAARMFLKGFFSKLFVAIALLVFVLAMANA